MKLWTLNDLRAIFSAQRPTVVSVIEPMEHEFFELPLMAAVEGGPSEMQMEREKIQGLMQSYAEAGKAPLADADFAMDIYDPTDIYANDMPARPSMGQRLSNALRGLTLSRRS